MSDGFFQLGGLQQMNIKNQEHRWLAMAIGLVLSGGAAAADVAASGNAGIDEIVVTAQKRTEKLRDVPVSVTVVDEKQLAAQRIYSIADLARTAPSLEMIQAFGGPGGGGQIRGVGTQSFTRSAEGAVGIVVDGVPQGNLPNLGVYDIGRVEVLRGPQGTLFGLTSSAGVINMSTVAPDPSGFSTTAHIDYSNGGSGGSEFGQQTLRGAVNLPIGNNSALRLAVNGNRVEGVQRNAATGKDNVLNEFGVRGRYLWNGEGITLNLSADWNRRNQNYGDPQFVYVNVPAHTPLESQLAACGIVASYDNNSRCSNLPNHSQVRNYGFSAQVDWDLAGGTLTSITGYRRNEQLPSSVDIMGNPAEFTQIFITDSINEGKQVTQEVRFASPVGEKVDYVAGAFFSDYKAATGYAPGGSFQVGSFQLAPFFIPFLRDTTSTRTTSQSQALFGQANYHVDDKLTFLGGLRYTHQKLTDSDSTGAAGRVAKSNLSGKLGVQYKVSDELSTYATLTRGYKGPQVIPSAQGSPTVVIKPEIPTAFEVGAKGAALDGRLGYEVAVFYTKVKDYQGQRCRINGVGVLVCLGESIPSVKSKGIELSAYGKLAEGLTVNAGFAYTDAKFPAGWTGYNPNDLRNPVPGTAIGQTSLGGLQIVGVPKTKFTLNGEYSHSLGMAEGFVGLDAVHKSVTRLAYSSDPRFVYPSHWTVGARAGIRGEDGKWSVEVFARNLGKEREPATLFGGPSFLPPGVVPFLPNGQVDGISGWTVPTSLRQVGLSAEVRF